MTLGGGTGVAALCFLLALNCFSAQETDDDRGDFTIDNILERILDYVETSDLETDRDEHFWDGDYWSIPYDQVLLCPSDYGWTGDFETGTCDTCPQGTEQFNDHWKETCKPCPVGTFNDDIMNRWCSECPNDAGRATTFKTGAMDADECVDPEDLFGESSYQSEVSVEVQLTGDWSWMEDLLWEVSGINFYELRAHVSYDESDDYSTIKARAMLPNFLAMQAHMGLLVFTTYVVEINDYVSLADHYAKIIFRLLNHAEVLSLLGLQMNYDELNLKNLKVLSTMTHLKQDCLRGYHPVEWEGVGTRCEADSDSDEAISKERSGGYMMYKGESDACKSLGGEARLREFVETSWPFPCLQDNQCEVHLSTSKELASGQCALVIYLNIDTDIMDQLSSAGTVWYGDTVSFEYVEESLDTDCYGSPTIETDSTFQCPFCNPLDGGYRLTQSGNCEKCPFGTWLPGESLATTCVSCPFDRPGTLYGVVPASSLKCINSYLETWESGIREYGNYMAAEQMFDLNVDVEMNMCEVDRIKKNFNNYCSHKYNMDDLSFEDFTDFDLEKLSCVIVSRFSEIYEDNCQDSEYTWSDIKDDFPDYLDVRGAACFAAKSLYYIEENHDSDCENLETEKNIDMPFEFTDTYAGEFMMAGAVWMPLMSSVNKLVKFDFEAVAETIEGAMGRVGIYEMSKLTGLGMMDHVRDLIIAIPRGLNVRQGSFEAETDLTYLLCDNGNPKKDCDYSCEPGCPRVPAEGEQPTCTADPCNECEETWSLNGNVYDCSLTCEAPNQIDHGQLFDVQVRRNYGDYTCTYDSCSDYTAVYRYVCDKNYRLKSGEEYDEEVCKDMYGDDNEYYCIYQDDSNYRLSAEPECVPEECEYPELENGYITERNDGSRSFCISAEYLCDKGYTMEGDYRVNCWKDGTFSEMPKCVPSEECDFPETMENSKLIAEFTSPEWSEEGKIWRHKGWYQCQNGYRYNQYYVYQEVSCGEETSCEDHYYNCPGIQNGYLLREWEVEDGDYYVGDYRCNPGFELRNPEIYGSEQDYREKYGWGKCDLYEGKHHLPSCVSDGSAVPCNMPKQTWNGYLVEEVTNEDGIVTHGQYECIDGYIMVETWKGDGMGWCRSDGSFELPYCMTYDQYLQIEFELESSFGDTENSGFVKAREVYADESTGDWHAGCDDRFNDFAAGAMCRSMGFQQGKRISPRKMGFMPDIEFGWTNVHCMYDDTLIMSPTCHADRYGEAGEAVCGPDEQIAVKCFDDFWSVSVEFQYTERRGKMFCPIEIIKEGEVLKLKNMGLRVEWGGVKMSGDDKEMTELEENVHYISRGFHKKRGFRAKYIGNKSDFDCFYCKVFVGETSLNPEFDMDLNCDA